MLANLPLYHSCPESELLEAFGVSPEEGLREEDVRRRREKDGWNELRFQPGKPPWLRFLLQFHQPLLYILLLAGMVKAFLGVWVNAWVIWGVTLINALIGYVQEAKAEGAIAALAKVVTTETTVARDGQTRQLPSRELVPGDWVFLTSGDKVPADLRLLQTRNLQIDESALTGESAPAEKSAALLPEETPLAERFNMAYGGTFVTAGQGQGLVVATGNGTEVGQISQSLSQNTNLSTPLTRKFAHFSRTLLYVVLSLATFTFVVGLGRGSGWAEMFEAAVALAVSAIPEGLPAVVTITLAIGVNRMAKRHAIIRKLPAVEALGSATVICSDKTGTLTENQMTVQAVFAGGRRYRLGGGGYEPEGEIWEMDSGATKALSPGELPPDLRDCLRAGLLCNNSRLQKTGADWSIVGDPTEGALITAAAKGGLSQTALTERYPRLDTIPFESEYQYMATLHGTAPRRIYVKGSAEALLGRCSQMKNAQGETVPLGADAITREGEAMAQEGLRVLAFAEKPAPDYHQSLEHEDIAADLLFLGLQGMIDPPRPSAITAVADCQRAGIEVKMITGDHITTAQTIAQQMGIQNPAGVIAYGGQELAAMTATELEQAARAGSVFARVAPAQKLQLVEALQAQGQIVAMTGDGVNDAPALKQADIGIAMGKGGTEVAREAAAMLLTDDNFASIKAAVEEGRKVYQNLRKAIAFLLPVNGGESMTILLSALLGRDLPILSLQVLWLNMLNSITMTVPLSFEPKSAGTMSQPPRNSQEPLLTRSLWGRILIVSVFNWILIFGFFEWVKADTGNLPLARTMAIQALVAARIVYLLSISQLGKSLLQFVSGRASSFTNAPILLLGIGLAILLQVLFSQWTVMNTLFATAPLNAHQALVCLLPALPMIPAALWANAIDPPTAGTRRR